MEEERLTKKERRALAKEEKRKTKEKNKHNKKLKKWFLGLVVLSVLIYSGYKFVIWFRTPATGSSESSQEILGVSIDSDWIKGNSEAAVTLVEYSDFQCPACAGFADYVDRLHQDFPDDLRIVYRHFPLESIHSNSFAAALSAEAAGVQGKFWQMHDILFERQVEWSNEEDPKEKFVGYAIELDLDEVNFFNDLESTNVSEKVSRDLFSAQQLGLNSTPTFFLNGEKIQPKNYDEFKELIETQIRGYTIE